MPQPTRRRGWVREPTEQIRRREVARVLNRTDLSPGEQEIVERLSCSLVRRVLVGSISEITARIETSGPDDGTDPGKRATGRVTPKG